MGAITITYIKGIHIGRAVGHLFGTQHTSNVWFIVGTQTVGLNIILQMYQTVFIRCKSYSKYLEFVITIGQSHSMVPAFNCVRNKAQIQPWS